MITKEHQQSINLSQLLRSELISFLQVKTRDEVIEKLASSVHEAGLLLDRDKFLQAVFSREALMSTGIGLQVAIPHAKLDTIDRFFISVGLLQTPIEWYSIDSEPVSVVFLIGGPAQKQTQYLQILSQITLAIKDEGKREHLLLAKTPKEVVDLFLSR